MWGLKKIQLFLYISFLTPSLAATGISPNNGKRASELKVVMTDVVDSFQIPIRIGNQGILTWMTVDHWSSLSWVSPSTQPTSIRGYGGTKTIATKSLNTTYFNGTSALGDLVSDRFSLDSTDLTDLTFGITTGGSLKTGVLGLGIEGPQLREDLEERYEGLLQRLVNGGHIKDAIYSFFWDAKDEDAQSNGTIIFGAIDTKAYTGRLAAIPLSRDDDFPTLRLSSVSLSTPAGSFSMNESVPISSFLDTSEPFIRLPERILSPLLDSMDISAQEDRELSSISCAHLNSTSTLALALDKNMTIQIPLRKLITEDSANSCKLNVGVSSDPHENVVVLGRIFQRYTYLVFDLTRDQILMAPAAIAAITNHTSNIVEVSGLRDGINGSGVPDIEGAVIATLHEPPTQACAKRFPIETLAGLCVGVCGVTAIIVLVFLFFRKKEKEEEEDEVGMMKSDPNEGYVHPMFQNPNGGGDNVTMVGQGWAIETKNGIKHAGWVRSGIFTLGKK